MKGAAALVARSPEQAAAPTMPGEPVSRDEVARIWQELAAGRWRVLAAADAGRLRHVVLARAARGDEVDWGGLDARERRIVALAAEGTSQKVIGFELGLSPASVSQILKRVRQRLGFASLAQLARAYRAM
jgi:DNA-binding NarL/FixJ family response regulator